MSELTIRAFPGPRFSSPPVQRRAARAFTWTRSPWHVSDLDWGQTSTLSSQQTERAHHLASQGMFTEEAGLLTACNLARLYDDRAVRRLMSQQASDEAKHSEVFEKYVTARFGAPIPRVPATDEMLAGLETIDDPVRLLLAHTLLEGLALDHFVSLAEDFSGDLLGEIYGLVRADEARHVAVGMTLSRTFVASRSASQVAELYQWCQEHVLHRMAGLMSSSELACSDLPGFHGPGTVAALLTRRFHGRCRQIFNSSTGVQAHEED